MTAPTPQCSNCNFFELEQGGSIFGICHRYPPHKPTPPAGYSIWPVVKTRDWCGEHAFPIGVIAAYTEPVR